MRILNEKFWPMCQGILTYSKVPTSFSLLYVCFLSCSLRDASVIDWMPRRRKDNERGNGRGESGFWGASLKTTNNTDVDAWQGKGRLELYTSFEGVPQLTHYGRNLS